MFVVAIITAPFLSNIIVLAAHNVNTLYVHCTNFLKQLTLQDIPSVAGQSMYMRMFSRTNARIPNTAKKSLWI